MTVFDDLPPPAVLREIDQALATIYPDDFSARLEWLLTPHALLDGLSPTAVVESGRAEVVRDMLHALLEGCLS